MKRGIVFLVFLTAAVLSASPVWAADTVDVTVDVPALSTFAAGADVTLTALVADLDNTYMFSADASSMILQDNTGSWTLTAQLSALYTDYSLWIEDSQAAGNSTGASFKQIVAVSATALNSFASYGSTGDFTYDLDWLVTGLGWTTVQSSQTKTVTFTHST